MSRVFRIIYFIALSLTMGAASALAQNVNGPDKPILIGSAAWAGKAKKSTGEESAAANKALRPDRMRVSKGCW